MKLTFMWLHVSQQQLNCDDFIFTQGMMALSEKEHNPSLTAVIYISPAVTVWVWWRPIISVIDHQSSSFSKLFIFSAKCEAKTTISCYNLKQQQCCYLYIYPFLRVQVMNKICWNSFKKCWTWAKEQIIKFWCIQVGTLTKTDCFSHKWLWCDSTLLCYITLYAAAYKQYMLYDVWKWAAWHRPELAEDFFKSLLWYYKKVAHFYKPD